MVLLAQEFVGGAAFYDLSQASSCILPAPGEDTTKIDMQSLVQSTPRNQGKGDKIRYPQPS